MTKRINGFTMIEVLVALVILAVGLLGMAGVTVMVMRSGKGAEDLANTTNVCQQKIEELKNIDFKSLGSAPTLTDPNASAFGIISEGIMQAINLNAQGLSRPDFYTQQSTVNGSPCYSVPITDAGCSAFLDKSGPYKYVLNFVVCRGDDYTPTPPAPMGAAANPSNFPNTAMPNCLVDPNDTSTRPQALSCGTDDILTKGAGSPEKMIKMLCTWRAKDGSCHFVNFSSLRMNNL